MCGILGYISTDKPNKKTLESSLKLLSSRGPDFNKISRYSYKKTSVYFGHTRLSIIDLSKKANQPMEDSSKKYSLVFNGEIYNYKDLRRELKEKGHTFFSESDTEVILKGYKEWGSSIVEKLDGMFAFALLDLNKGILLLAKDPFGQKPLYYFIDKKTIMFSSELKSLLVSPSFKKEVDTSSVSKYLVFGYIPSPNSIYKNIKKIKPSTYLELDLNTLKIKREVTYWKLESMPLNTKIKENKVIDELDYLLNKAVKKRLISDVPLGVFLSGGLDSSLITAIMTKYSNNVQAFTVSYKKYKYDESFYAQKTADYLGISLTKFNFEGSKVSTYSKEILTYLDGPLADPAIIPLYFLAKNSKPKITVALSGDGGDEVFGGYFKYKAQLYAERLKHFSLFLKPLSKVLSPHSSYKRFLEGLFLPFYARHFVYGSGGFLPSELPNIKNILNLDLDYKNIFEEAQFYAHLFKQKDTINKALYLDCKVQLPDWYLVKGDRATMAASLELRNPFLDKSLVEFAFSLPGHFKYNRGVSKYILKKLGERYLPKEIVYRKKKGFAVDIKPLLTENNSALPPLKQFRLDILHSYFNYEK